MQLLYIPAEMSLTEHLCNLCQWVGLYTSRSSCILPSQSGEAHSECIVISNFLMRKLPLTEGKGLCRINGSGEKGKDFPQVFPFSPWS